MLLHKKSCGLTHEIDLDFGIRTGTCDPWEPKAQQLLASHLLSLDGKERELKKEFFKKNVDFIFI